MDNPLAKIAPLMQAGPSPQPTHAQTVAAMHRFSSVQRAMQEVVKDPQFGKGNIRPKLLDVASKLLGAKVLSLPDIMNTIKDLPEDPIKQKAFVEGILTNAAKAQMTILQHHRTARIDGEPDEYDMSKQSDHIGGLMGHYSNGRS